MSSKATKPPAEQGGPAPDRAGTLDAGRSPEAETGEERGLARILEEALAEARAEVARREEVEQKLDRVRIEAASLAIELNQAERNLEEARRTVKPNSAERMAKLDAELVQTRSELEHEQASRERLQRDYDAAALQSGAQLKQLREDAKRARAEAQQARAEADRTTAELKTSHERLVAIEQLLEAATKKDARQQGAEPPPVQPLTETPQSLTDESPGAPIAGPGRLSRRKRMFGVRGRTCAVCRRTEASSPGGLKAAGWALGSEIDLCPDCQEEGWQLPKGGSLPFRRSSQHDRAG